MCLRVIMHVYIFIKCRYMFCGLMKFEVFTIFNTSRLIRTWCLCYRKAKIDWRSPSFEAKVAGTLVSIMGAVSITLYKGPVIKYSPSRQLQLHLSRKLFLFSSSHENWILGAILLVAASFTISIWNIIQVSSFNFNPFSYIYNLYEFHVYLAKNIFSTRTVITIVFTLKRVISLYDIVFYIINNIIWSGIYKIGIYISSLDQVKTLQAYPEPMTIVSFYILFGTILSAALSLYVERDISAWVLKPNMELLIIILTVSLIFSTWQYISCTLINNNNVIQFT